jgi:zinc protease
MISFASRVLIAALVVWIVRIQDANAKVYNPDTFMLPNGMQVVVVTNKRAPIVTHMVWYKVGSADEPKGKSGIAHFLEHMMFKATANMKSGEFSSTVARNGGRDNAFTSNDYTGYFQTIAKDRLELVMRMEADRMINIQFNDEQVEPERQVILEERNMRTDNSPEARLSEEINAAFYRNHPYQIPVIGWRHEIEALSRQDLESFYKLWYHPNNAILVVAGDITMNEVRPLAEKYYGKLPAGPLPQRTRPSEPPHVASQRVSLADARVRQPNWRRLYLAPSMAYGDTSLVHALEVGSEILGGGATSRLYRTLVVEENKAVSTGSHYDDSAFGPTTFTLSAAPQQGVSLDEIEKMVEAEIAKLLKDGVTQEEVERAKKRMQASAVYARDSAGRGARALGAALASGQTVEDVESWPDRIGAVTADQVNAALRAILKDEGALTATLVEKEKAQ